MIKFFAGAESAQLRDLLRKCGVKNILLSYYYIEEKNVEMEEVLPFFDRVVVDSGAFTMMASEGYDMTVRQHEKYLDRYIAFLEKYSGQIFYAANYDVNLIVGHDIVFEWNTIFERLEQGGQKICYVSHDDQFPYRNLYAYFDRYSFLGVAQGVHSKKEISYFEQTYLLSRKKKKLVHGFAMTNFVSFNKFPLYSVDSTTYIGGSRYGSTYYFNGAFFETLDYKHKHYRKRFKFLCDMWGIDFKAFCADDTWAVMEFNVRMWLLNERNYNRLTVQRQWWLTDEEKRKIQRDRITYRIN